jgi:long-chain fatty acid transport protein
MKTTTRVAACLPLALAGAAAWATNGMNMEGYGPVSTGMGGASQAIDHGTAAMAQNPATLALMGGTARVDVAVGRLGPGVTSRMAGMPDADSGGTSYVMPALGYARRNGAWTYGFGVFAQGGMGTEYDATSFVAAGSGQPVRSELGVGRVLFPLAYRISPTLAVGGSLDFVWATLDMRMAASGAQLGQMVTGASGNLGAALPALGGAPWARVDFSDGSDFSGAAKGTGWAGKLGFVWQAAPAWSVGGSYQFETALGDLKTSTSAASLSAAGGFADAGRITVIDFQWPATAAIGASWQASPTLTVAADLKRIAWSKVMKDFRLQFDSAGMGGSVGFALTQDWKDQTVVNLGVAWKATPQWTLRAGVNLADNPIPNAFVNPLFPATVKNHATLGAGWQFGIADSLDLSLTVAPSSTVTNGQGIEVSHRQTNAQLMYSHLF